MTPKRPDIVKDEHLAYLDDLRDSGVVNMWGAAPFLANTFDGLNRDSANIIFDYWKDTYSERNLRCSQKDMQKG